MQRAPMLLEVARGGRIGAVAQHALFGRQILIGDTSERQRGLRGVRLGLCLVGTGENAELRLGKMLAADLGRVFERDFINVADGVLDRSAVDRIDSRKLLRARAGNGRWLTCISRPSPEGGRLRTCSHAMKRGA